MAEMVSFIFQGSCNLVKATDVGIAEMVSFISQGSRNLILY
jgi:hypothetical protein